MSDDLHKQLASTGMSPDQRSLRARIAAHASWARTSDRSARTSRGTEAFLERFEREVDPDYELPAEVRREMAVHARTAHMLRLARRSAAARRRKRRRYEGGGA